jgi:hypothetical protein
MMSWFRKDTYKSSPDRSGDVLAVRAQTLALTNQIRAELDKLAQSVEEGQTKEREREQPQNG